MKKIFVFIFIGLLIVSCSTQQKQLASSEANRQYITLMDYLRGIPGLQIVSEAYVTVRGMQSMVGEQEPLYIIDGAQVGNSYVQANDMVDPNDIKNVRVLKDVNSTAIYGLRGSNGVIIIKTGVKD